jgi:hypothetical protein
VAIVCGPEPERFVDAIRKAERTGYAHVCLHQVGPEQEAFMRFCAREVFPALRRGKTSRTARTRTNAERRSHNATRPRKVARGAR